MMKLVVLTQIIMIDLESEGESENESQNDIYNNSAEFMKL